jgi:hypothetical protein
LGSHEPTTVALFLSMSVQEGPLKL